MQWQLHYRKDGQEFRALAQDRSAALAVACILLGDGHEVVRLESLAGDTIDAHEIRRLCQP